METPKAEPTKAKDARETAITADELGRLRQIEEVAVAYVVGKESRERPEEYTGHYRRLKELLRL